jgi:hypothetical protein
MLENKDLLAQSQAQENKVRMNKSKLCTPTKLRTTKIVVANA